MENSSSAIFFTFSYEEWSFAATLEIITSKFDNYKNIIWVDWASSYQKISEYPVSDKMYIYRIRKQLKKYLSKTILQDFLIQSKLKIIRITPDIKKIESNIEALASEVAYLELVARFRESKPVISSYQKLYEDYKKIFIEIYNSSQTIINQEKPSHVYIFNGRFLKERAVWEASKASHIPVFFYEKFNPGWIDRYHIFKSPTHSPEYRSSIMENFGAELMKNDLATFFDTGNQWFFNRKNGISQSYTEKQNQTIFRFEKPYLVFFHSSEDELITTDLVSKVWGNQISALSTLIKIMEKNQKYRLIIRIHPNLLHKSKKEIKEWNDFGTFIQDKYNWITYLEAQSAVNSYSLIEESSGVITVGSTIGVEAAYMGKRSILLGTAFHEKMGITYNPNNEKELWYYCNNSLTDSEKNEVKINALKYAAFHSLGGSKFKFSKSITKGTKTYYKFGELIIKKNKFIVLINKVYKYRLRHKLLINLK